MGGREKEVRHPMNWRLALAAVRPEDKDGNGFTLSKAALHGSSGNNGDFRFFRSDTRRNKHVELRAKRVQYREVQCAGIGPQ